MLVEAGADVNEKEFVHIYDIDNDIMLWLSILYNYTKVSIALIDEGINIYQEHPYMMFG